MNAKPEEPPEPPHATQRPESTARDEHPPLPVPSAVDLGGSDPLDVPATSPGFAPPPVNGLLVLVLILAGAVLIRDVSELVVPLLFGAFLALVAWPTVVALERRNVHRAIALAVTVLVVFVVVVGAAVIVSLSMAQLVVLVSRYEDRLAASFVSLQAELANLGIDANTDALLRVLSPQQVADVVRSIASAVSGAGVAILVISLTTIYALVGAASMRERAEAALGRDHALLRGVGRFGAELRRYLVVRAALGAFAAGAVFVLLVIVSVPSPALWAFLVFAASFIPNVGVILAVIPPTILAALDSGLGAAVAVVVGYLVVNLVQDNVLQPVVLGSELNLSPLVVFVAVVIWAWILGAPGALLAVPMTLAVVAILEAFPASRGLASLMRNRAQDPRGLIS